jgi:recombinational DNA repair ATPase RecF
VAGLRKGRDTVDPLGSVGDQLVLLALDDHRPAPTAWVALSTSAGIAQPARPHHVALLRHTSRLPRASVRHQRTFPKLCWPWSQWSDSGKGTARAPTVVMMDDSLLTAVFERLDEIPIGDPVAEGLVLAALEGEEKLSVSIEGDGAPIRNEITRPVPAEPHAPAGAYLRSVRVAGFRGIGPATTLDLEPGPGLTVVCGRNGSGKSSLAEALEVLLTGTTKRWQDRSAVWRETWRCLHNADCSISAELLVEGTTGPARVAQTWSPEAQKVDDSTLTVQVAGEPKAGIERLGWGDALSSFRPFLSHAELEALLSEPKDLYNQLNSLLGLEELEHAAKLLAEARRQADKIVRAPKEASDGLRLALDGSADARAKRARTLLAAKAPDVDELEALATGSQNPATDTTAVLEELARLTVPSAERVAAAGEGLRSAAVELRRVAETAAGDAAATADLLEAALRHFDGHGPGDCPVCGRADGLDEQWHRDTEARVMQLRDQAAEARAARRSADETVAETRQLVGRPPEALSRADETGMDAAAALEAWRTWSSVPSAAASPEELEALADHIERRHPPLVAAVAQLVAEAKLLLEARQDEWRPLAARLSTWCALARAGQTAKLTVARTKKAEDWLKAANDHIRNDQIRPFADKTVALWSELRQESNVELIKMRLAGAANRSHVDFAVAVDGKPATGLGVMSQGEINALALSVFLPRATAAGSPLRFLIIDDPVQAMDPSKVDGLARVLVQVAADRQVVVFTHDDRLPSSVRRLNLPARIVQVTRRADSVVEVHPAGDPCEQLLRDAAALARGERVPVQVGSQVVPGICRTAIETVCTDITRRRRLGRGDEHGLVESALLDVQTLMHRLALAIFDDPARAGDVYEWLNKRVGGWAADTVRACNKGAHGGTNPDLGNLVANSRSLVGQLQAKLP